MNCPHCGELISKCEYEYCENFAKWNAWFRAGMMNVRLNVCDDCVKKSIGWKAKENAPD